ncbi:MAG: hypothetical protein HKN49_10010, partial [Gammaproteobacteria bacterium]|nr:hypothetical protein [Gammaproteobacteria bacterium]
MTGNTFRHRPWPLGLANRLAGSLRLDQRVRLDPDELVSCVGAADLGDGDWRDRLERLCVALNEQARLNLVGRLSARSHLLQLLRNRLTLAQARAQDPQISAGSIAAPLFITGLPRTGSTLLHGLLSQDPALATPLTWEVMLPPRRSGFSRDPNATNVARPQVGG